MRIGVERGLPLLIERALKVTWRTPTQKEK
jgi:hypothetical protein